MKIPKPTAADLDAFRAMIPDVPGVEVKPMFGNLGAFVNGNMFAGLFGSDVGVKLAADDLAALAAAGGGPFGPPERPMGGYVTLPLALRHDTSQATVWVGRALAHVGTLPPKTPKPKSAKKPAPGARKSSGR